MDGKKTTTENPMEGKKNLTENPAEIYLERFRAADPAEMSERSGIAYADGLFSLSFLGRPLNLSWPDMKAVFTDNGAEASHYIRILVTRLLLGGKLSAAKGNMLAYTDMPWGNVYAVQFRGRCISRLAGVYGSRIKAFEEACEALGAKKAASGDISYDFELISGLTVRFILWEGDDEFPASAQVLFSDNFPDAFKAEDIAVVGDILLNALKGRW